MITDNRYFSESLTEINIELYKESTKLNLSGRLGVSNFTSKSLLKQFEHYTRTFPTEIISASESIEISLYVIQLNYLFQEVFDENSRIPQELINKFKEEKKSYKLEEHDRYVIYDFLEDYFHQLVYSYRSFIKNAKKEPCFVGINNEEIILKNLLIQYKKVISSKKLQIKIFPNITLTKTISDKVISMLIDFIEQRLKVLNPDISLSNNEYKINHIHNKIEKIKWLGTQQDLVELFLELANKNWIEEVDQQKRKTYVRSIISLFDIEDTKRSKKSDAIDSVYRKFNGVIEDGKRVYPFLEKDNYRRKFENIIKN